MVGTSGVLVFLKAGKGSHGAAGGSKGSVNERRVKSGLSSGPVPLLEESLSDLICPTYIIGSLWRLLCAPAQLDHCLRQTLIPSRPWCIVILTHDSVIISSHKTVLQSHWLGSLGSSEHHQRLNSVEFLEMSCSKSQLTAALHVFIHASTFILSWFKGFGVSVFLLLLGVKKLLTLLTFACIKQTSWISFQAELNPELLWRGHSFSFSRLDLRIC